MASSKEVSDKKAKRHRKRKARTQVSISPESSDQEASIAPSTGSIVAEKQSKDKVDAPSTKKHKCRKAKGNEEAEAAEPAAADVLETQEMESRPAANSDKVPASFESYYLRLATSEFAEDLDKVRSASDFRDASLPVLVNALQQGASIFSMDEMRRVMTARTGDAVGK
ncbi:MAG: hypothetical protein M1812_000921 [Candelaria pacifica]|nr:MAG: hypothetical protein M1812_000921 [Candelaria pacifica]